MAPEVLAAYIGAAATLGGAVLGGLAGRSDLFARLTAARGVPSLKGTTWESEWKPGGEIQKKARIEFTRQQKGRVYGKLTMDGLKQIVWDVEGIFDGQFLRLFWHPNVNSLNKLATDIGVYFYQRQGDGTFIGWSVGYEFEDGQVHCDRDSLRQL